MYVTYGCPTVNHFLDTSLQKYISEVKKKSHVSENLKIIHIVYICVCVCVCVCACVCVCLNLGDIQSSLLL